MDEPLNPRGTLSWKSFERIRYAPHHPVRIMA